MTVSRALDEYWQEHVQPNVVDKRRTADCIAHLKAWFKDTLLRDVDIPASRGYADARRMGIIGGGRRMPNGEGSDSTIRRELGVLNAAAKHALRWKRITHAELPSVERPREAPHREAWLTQDELARSLAAATGRLKDFIAVAYYTGARRRSVERLTRFQVDLKAGRINLSSPTENDNERRSKKRRPVVPIDPAVRPVVERLMTENADSEFLFGDDRDMYVPFSRHLAALGLADKAFPHVLRHSRATHLLQSGVSLWDVAKLLGDTVATVERVYGHHSSDYLATAIRGKA